MTANTGFDEFVTTRSPRLLRLAVLLTHDHALAEDLLQTALAKSWSAWRRIDDDPEPYVRRVLVNTFNSWWRRRWTAEHPAAVLPDRAWSGAHGEIDDRDEVWRALSRLPRQQRAVLVLRYFEDLSEAQIAETLGVSTGAVKNYAAKGLAKLRLDPTLSELPRPDLPEAPVGTARLAAVRSRIGQRRRLAVAGVVGMVILAVLLSLVVAPRVNTSLPPAERKIGGFAEYQGGRRIVAVGQGDPVNPVVFTWTPSTLDIQFVTRCTRPGDDEFSMSLAVLFNGRRSSWKVGCLVAPGRKEVGNSSPTKPELAALGVRIGEPVTVTLTDPQGFDLHSPSPQPAKIPRGAMVAVGLGEAVPFEEFPLPSRPRKLEPLLGFGLPPVEGRTQLSSNGPRNATIAWSNGYLVDGTSQTPGRLLIRLNGVHVYTLTWWDYEQASWGGNLVSGEHSDGEAAARPGPTIPDFPEGTPVTVTIEAQNMTGDWMVNLNPGG